MSKNMQKYKIVKSDTLFDLEKNVMYYIKEGFIPHGQVILLQEKSGITFYQPLVKENA